VRIRYSFLILLLATRPVSQDATRVTEAPKPVPAVPVDAITGIVDKFRTHNLVALSDAHGELQAGKFLISLIRDPRFAQVVNDVVVEFGNARYQGVIDRFVRGEPVPDAELRRVWQDTTQAAASVDLPIYADFYRAVRDVNSSLPSSRQLRVVLGDPPIKWEDVRNNTDHRKWVDMRDWHPAAVVQIEVVAKQRRALIVYGHGHFQRKNQLSNYDMSDWRSQTIVSLLETAGIPVFTIWRDSDLAKIQPDVSSWQTPAVSVVKGTILGAAPASAYLSAPRRYRPAGDKITEVPRPEWKEISAEQQLDAVLYLGPSSTLVQAVLSPELCADKDYMAMRVGRMKLIGMPPAVGETLQKDCAARAAK
jgi:hypothetical protein